MSRASAISGAKWASTIGLGRQGLQFIVGGALARLFAPEEFGLIASVYMVTNFAVILFDMGLVQASIHHNRTSERDKSTVSWANRLSAVWSTQSWCWPSRRCWPAPSRHLHWPI